MSIFGFSFKSSGSDSNSSELPNIFPFGLKCTDFVKFDLYSTYTKILTDVAERSHGLDDDEQAMLWDSVVQSESNCGLISLLAWAMVGKCDLFLVIKEGVIRKATDEEVKLIKADYAKQAESKTGVYVSFQNFLKTDMLTIYSDLEYAILSSLNKTLNLSKAIQIKIDELRSSVGLADSDVAIEQARNIARSLSNGKDVLLSGKDVIETAKVDVTPTQSAMQFLDGKRAFILGFPLSYISGEQTGGIGSTGEGDARAVEQGLKQYFYSIWKPICKALFDAEVKFKSLDFKDMAQALEALKTFDIVSNDFLSVESKQQIMARVWDLDADEEAKNLEADKAAGLDDPQPGVTITKTQRES